METLSQHDKKGGGPIKYQSKMLIQFSIGSIYSHKKELQNV